MTRRFTLPAGGDVPPDSAAKRLGLTLEEFLEKLPLLLERDFPPPDPDTGNYDLDAIDKWRRRRHPLLFGELLTPPRAPAARDAKDVVAERVARLRNG